MPFIGIILPSASPHMTFNPKILIFKVTRGADETDGNHNSSVGPYMQGNQDGLRLHECERQLFFRIPLPITIRKSEHYSALGISPPLLNPLPKVAAMTTQSSELNGVTNSSSVWGDFVDSDGECDVEDACEPINRYEEGLYLPICIGEVIAGRYRIEHKLGHGGFLTVWMAYDMHKGKDVALKIMTADPGGEREFLRQNEIISCVPDTSRLLIYQETFLLPGAARNPHRIPVSAWLLKV